MPDPKSPRNRRTLYVGLVMVLLMAITIPVGLWTRGNEEFAYENAVDSTSARTQLLPEPSARKSEISSLSVPTEPAGHRRRQIAGVVLHGDGTPAAGWRVDLSHEATPGVLEVHAGQLSEEDGTFTFTGDWVAGLSRLEVEIPGRPREICCTQDVPEGAESTALVLRVPTTLFVVTVADSRGRALPGVTLTAMNVPQFPDAFTGIDGTGRFHFLGIESVALRAQPWDDALRRYLPAWKEAVVAFGATRIVLEDAAVASGVVLAPDGSPASWVPIVSKCNHNVIENTVSGADGRFEVKVPLNGTAELTVQHRVRTVTLENADGKPQRIRGGLPGVRAGDSGLLLRTEWIEPGCRLEVHVLSPDFEPVVGARVVVKEQLPLSDHEAASDARGLAVFEGLDKVEYDLLAIPPATPAAADWMRVWNVGVEPGGETEEVTLQRGCRVKGVILRPDGTPAGKATLHVNKQGIEIDEYMDGNVPVDADGKFTFLLGLNAAQDLQLTATADGGALEADRTIDARGLREDVLLHLINVK